MTRSQLAPVLLAFFLASLVACGGETVVSPVDTGVGEEDIQLDAGSDTGKPDVPVSPCEGAAEGTTCDDGDPCTLASDHGPGKKGAVYILYGHK